MVMSKIFFVVLPTWWCTDINTWWYTCMMMWFIYDVEHQIHFTFETLMTTFFGILIYLMIMNVVSCIFMVINVVWCYIIWCWSLMLLLRFFGVVVVVDSLSFDHFIIISFSCKKRTTKYHVLLIQVNIISSGIQLVSEFHDFVVLLMVFHVV